MPGSMGRSGKSGGAGAGVQALGLVAEANWVTAVEPEPDNLIQYPTHRMTDYTARRAVNG